MRLPFIRLANEDDLPSINDIYNHYVEHSTCTYQVEPESMHDRWHWFRGHDSHHPVTVIEADGAVVGWASLNVYNCREAYSRTVENSIYIKSTCHRLGLGRALLIDQIERASVLGHHTILAGISAEQKPSIALHQSLGFVQVAHFRETVGSISSGSTCYTFNECCKREV